MKALIVTKWSDDPDDITVVFWGFTNWSYYLSNKIEGGDWTGPFSLDQLIDQFWIEMHMRPESYIGEYILNIERQLRAHKEKEIGRICEI